MKKKSPPCVWVIEKYHSGKWRPGYGVWSTKDGADRACAVSNKSVRQCGLEMEMQYRVRKYVRDGR